ncbi:MAG: hypothetical protein ACE5JV_01285 [Nitrososphaerales archaeon]
MTAVEAQRASLSVSAAESGGKFFGPQIVQIVIDSPGLRNPDTTAASLVVKGTSIPLVHLTDSRWYAFVADRNRFTTLADAANLPGNEVSAAGGSFWALGPSGKPLLFPSLPGAFGHDTSQNAMNPNLDLTGDCPATVADSDPCVEWPYIALLSFSKNDRVSFRYSSNSVTLPYIDPSFDDVTISLDRQSYPVGAEIILTLADYMWNINPVEEDRIHFAFSGSTAQAFYQASSVLEPESITGILNSLGFDSKQILRIAEIDSIEFTNTINGVPETVLQETFPNSGVFENFNGRADMFAKERNALILFDYFDKSTASGMNTSDASVTIGKEEEESEAGTQLPEEGEDVEETITEQQELYSVGEPRLADLVGDAIDKVVAEIPVIVEMDIENNLEEEQPFVYILQVKDSDGFTEMLTWIKGRIGSAGILESGISWTPEQSGTYELEVFVWRSLDDPGLPPPVRTMTITVEDLQV